MDQSTADHTVFSNDGSNANIDGNTSNSTFQNMGQSAADKYRSGMDSIQNNPQVQNVKETVTNGPLAQGVKSEYANTRSEFQNLANSRQRPSETTATGQPLTHYHSMFYNLLSWQNPRATAIAYLTTVAFIFASRYLPILRYLFKGLYLSLGVTATAEIVGRALFSNGFATQVRPRRYYTLPKDSVDRFLDDVHELVNFFVIELQRILFAENIVYTLAAFFFSLISYFLIKLVPFWGFALIAVTDLYLIPFIYVNNKELIDNQLRNLSQMLNQQAVQVKDLASQNAARARDKAQAYSRDYSAKAQQYVGAAKQRVASQTNAISGSGAQKNDATSGQAYTNSDFPSAPDSAPHPIADQFASKSGMNGESDSRQRADYPPVPAT